ncbi:LysR family transcriptional regulator [Paenibacillus mendelii]|uniref:LysR family transcriptional regulator n=1 Tax=Paenibacillus mendelii TaxID=206163 RepID=A0ABV6JF82_9BACL|nr:LysR family transcriptional regulator [Paenibacillus mendelii]MCQ6557441.1 LysR family transcriptional regulator [Paenibacillus mendelii]
MNIGDIRIFMAVVEQGSVSRAAEQLGYVQSNVTARIRSLEQEIGRPLFHRHRRGMTLNVEGRKLVTYGQQLMRLMSEMNKAFQDEDDPAGSLRIGLVETVVGLPDILSAYYRQYKQVELSIVTDVSGRLMEDVLDWKLDGAFIAGPVDVPILEQVPVFEEELVLVCGTIREESHTVQTGRELLGLPMLVFNQGCGYRARLQRWALEEGLPPLKIMEFGTLETIIGTVVAGLGVTLVSRASVEKLEREGSVRLFAIPEPYRHISFIYIRRSDAYLGEAERKFIQLISETKRSKMTI